MFDAYNEILTIDETAEALMVGRNRVYKLLNSGELDGFRIGAVWKIPRGAVIDFVRDHRKKKDTISGIC